MIFPKNDFLKVSIYLGGSLGVWPIAFQNNPVLRRIYDYYFRTTFFTFIVVVIVSAMELYVLTTSRADTKLILKNLCVTLLASLTVLKVRAVRGKNCLRLIKEVLSIEEGLIRRKDEELMQIYSAHIRQSKIANVLYMMNIMIEGISFVMQALYNEEYVKFDPITNTTIAMKPLPMSIWLPFDTQEHYMLSFVLCMLNIVVSGIYFTFVDMFSFSMIIFPLGQIRMLIHVFNNFNQYVMKVKERLHCSRHEASFLTMRDCIVKHKEIIEFVEDYNDATKNVMLLDFLQSSIQLASLTMQFVLSEGNIFDAIVFAEFIGCMMIRLLCYYWFANDIMLESQKISTAVFESGWYDEPDDVKKMMWLVIMRANKALTLDIGPFGTMTLDVLVGIIKTTYSYMTIMYR